MIVAGRHGARVALTGLIARLKPEIVPVTAEDAQRIGETYERWGKGVHPAGLNFGDCCAYVLAMQQECGLLYFGGDFSKTDVSPAG